MKHILLLLICVQTFNTFAEFARVVDQDGFVNLRSEAKIGNNIILEIRDGELVYNYGYRPNDTDKWVNINYIDSNSIEHYGYIHRSRLHFLNAYEKIPIIKNDNGIINLSDEKIFIEICIQSFNFEENKDDFERNKNGFFTHYKGKNIWGEDGGKPSLHYEYIYANINGCSVFVPEEYIENLFEPNYWAQSYYNEKENNLYLIFSNSDGAGSYQALFVFSNNQFESRKLIGPP